LDASVSALSQTRPCISEALGSAQYLHNGDGTQNLYRYLRHRRLSRILAQHYIDTEVIGAAKRVDAQHIAIATINRVEVLVSWNFRHIVNLQRIRGYNSVNLLQGYPLLEIRTPEEVINYEEE